MVRIFLVACGAWGAGCSQGVALSVSASFRDATGAVIYTGGGGGQEVNAATPPLSGSAVISAFVNGDGVDPVNVERVALRGMTVTAATDSACAARSDGCALGVCTATVAWSRLGACVFDVVADTTKGEVEQCVSFVLTVAGSDMFAEASDQATRLCVE